MSDRENLHRIAFLGNYLPRQCGIATFTTDLYKAVETVYPGTECLALPMNDRPGGYAYPPFVRFEVEQNEIASYRRAADFIQIHEVEALCVQHEFGIYGGEAGSYLLDLLREVKVPVVTTLHTILTDPTAAQRRVMDELITRSSRVVTMTRKGHELLRDVYDAPDEKIDLIAHGIPDTAFVDPNYYKDKFGVEGKLVLLTFGLLSAGKGIEYVISALPAILERHPNVVYIVLGATHPNVVAHEGEAYRERLQALAKSLGVEQNVVFYNQFVEIGELQEFIGAADIYITPYLNPAQITSGTLSYAFGAGKAVISTPYWHAEELLADGRGVLTPFADAPAVAAAVDDMLTNSAHRHSMRKSAYLLSREMIWPQTARKYMASFVRACADSARRPRPNNFALRMLELQPKTLPVAKLDHLRAMTDSTGLFQHGIFNVPNFHEGYTTDDNARAYILTTLLEELEFDNIRPLASTYLAFLWCAFNPANRRFRNFMGFGRDWLEKDGSEDSHGRALWALGTALGRSRDDGHRNLAGRLFSTGLGATLKFTSPRSWAFTILAIHEYLRRFSGDREASQVRAALAARLLGLYERCGPPDWHWFEDELSYDNARLPHALILTGHWTSQADVLKVGLTSLRWLVQLQTSASGCFSPIGSNGFYQRGGPRARFDQQPLEASATVSACLEAYRITNDAQWAQDARTAFEWFLGRNDLGMPLYDAINGGCRDGLHPNRVNQNQGAESTLSFHLALAEMRLAAVELDLQDAGSKAA